MPYCVLFRLVPTVTKGRCGNKMREQRHRLVHRRLPAYPTPPSRHKACLYGCTDAFPWSRRPHTTRLLLMHCILQPFCSFIPSVQSELVQSDKLPANLDSSQLTLTAASLALRIGKSGVQVIDTHP